MKIFKLSDISIIFLIEIISITQSRESKNLLERIPSFYENIIKPPNDGDIPDMNTPCTCGVFLDDQIANDNSVHLNEHPAFQKEMEIPIYPCGIRGTKLCTKKCMDTIINYMPNLGPLICASIDRDCTKEKSHLYIKNCDGTWHNTGFSAGKEFCCSNGLEIKCRNSNGHKETNIADLMNIGAFGSLRKYIPDILRNFAGKAGNIASSVLKFH